MRKTSASPAPPGSDEILSVNAYQSRTAVKFYQPSGLSGSHEQAKANSRFKAHHRNTTLSTNDATPTPSVTTGIDTKATESCYAAGIDKADFPKKNVEYEEEEDDQLKPREIKLANYSQKNNIPFFEASEGRPSSPPRQGNTGKNS